MNIKEFVSVINDALDSQCITEREMDQELPDLGIDSIGFIRIIMLLEIKYDISIPDENLVYSKLNTLNAIYLLVEDLLNKKAYQS